MKLDLLDSYNPHPGQVRMHRSRARFKTLVAGRRYGKDYCCAREFILKVFVEDYPKIAHLKPPAERFQKYSKPLLHYWIIAPDYNIGKIQQREIFSIFPQEFQASNTHFTYDDNKRELRILGGRILFEFKSADRPDTLVAVGVDGVYCTEFARFKEIAWGANIRPTLTDKHGWGLFTTTPLPKKWFIDFIELSNPRNPDRRPDYETFFGKTVDNIRIRDVVEEVESARMSLPARWFRREYEASMEFFEGQVYEDWNPTVHCPKPFHHPRLDMVVAGVDWGYAQPGAIMVFGISLRGTMPTFYLLDESYDPGVLILAEDGESWTRRAKILQAKYGISIFYCDTAEPNNIQIFRNAGLNAVGADKDVWDGIQSVSRTLHVSETSGNCHFYVDGSKCPNFCREVVPYQWGEDEDPVDENNHTLDAVRYVIHTFLKYGGNVQYLSTGEIPMRA